VQATFTLPPHPPLKYNKPPSSSTKKTTPKSYLTTNPFHPKILEKKHKKNIAYTNKIL
jgi:hypothetical protein